MSERSNSIPKVQNKTKSTKQKSIKQKEQQKIAISEFFPQQSRKEGKLQIIVCKNGKKYWIGMKNVEVNILEEIIANLDLQK